MAKFSPQVDDLILFFKNGDGVDKRWIPHMVYSDKALQLPQKTLQKVMPNWKGTVFSECPVDGGAFYFANLSLLVDPGPTKKLGDDLPKPSAYAKKSPGQGDLVLVPHDDGNNAYLVSKDLVLACPPMEDAEAYDPVSLVTEGVVLANMPKVDLSGYTCYLLNLMSLRTAALNEGDHKSDHAKRLANALAPKK